MPLVPVACLLAGFCAASVVASDYAPKFRTFAPTPPMGWNSWDCFGTTITEAQTKSQADAMASILKPFGWHYLTVDIQWYEPHSQGHDYREGAELAMDSYGRLVPAATKFPSSQNGVGFKSMADYVHSKGLKFGIHLMRGIARQAVKRNTPIKGSPYRAADIALPNHVCAWNPDMYGVDITKPGAQAYYDSLFEMYASWGVDLVKVDDISRPYDEVQRLEIEAIRKAIDRTKRPIVLSLSPGDTPLDRGNHVPMFANMWRISDDFWDRWDPLHGMFERLNRWSAYRTEGAWPDADMLPFGTIEFSRKTRFTEDEQRTCMTLWSIARSPLILGADMTKLDAFTTQLLTNPEVIEVNQHSHQNQQLFREDDLIAWSARPLKGNDVYVALFNARPNEATVDLEKAKSTSPIIKGKPEAEVAHIHVTLNGSKKLVLMVGDGGDGFSWDHSAWIEPKLIGPQGTLKLTDLKWKSATAGWGQAQVDRDVEGGPLMFGGKPTFGIGTHSKSIIVYDLPAGYTDFEAKGVLTDTSKGMGSVQFVVALDDAIPSVLPEDELRIGFAALGLKGKCRVRDLWSRKDLGEFGESFSVKLPRHGAALYRVTPL